MGSGPFISLKMERDRETSAFGGVKGTPPRRVLIGATALEGHILEILPPLVFSTDDAKLLPAALNDVLTALCWTHLQACQCKRAGGGIRGA